jgi:hypothetical protein
MKKLICGLAFAVVVSCFPVTLPASNNAAINLEFQHPEKPPRPKKPPKPKKAPKPKAPKPEKPPKPHKPKGPPSPPWP